MSSQNKESNVLAEKFKSGMDATKDAVANMNEKVKEKADSSNNQANQEPSFGEKVKDFANDVKDKVGNAFSGAKDKTEDAANTMENKAHELKGRTQ